jgi:hypothetical protein
LGVATFAGIYAEPRDAARHDAVATGWYFAVFFRDETRLFPMRVCADRYRADAAVAFSSAFSGRECAEFQGELLPYYLFREFPGDFERFRDLYRPSEFSFPVLPIMSQSKPLVNIALPARSYSFSFIFKSPFLYSSISFVFNNYCIFIDVALVSNDITRSCCLFAKVDGYEDADLIWKVLISALSGGESDKVFFTHTKIRQCCI